LLHPNRQTIMHHLAHPLALAQLHAPWLRAIQRGVLISAAWLTVCLASGAMAATVVLWAAP
jgi:hypothetical protein